MRVVVIGCGRYGTELADRLFRKNHEVDIVDKVPSTFDELPDDFIGRTHEGDALHQDVLERSGIKKADALATVTSSDMVNLVVAHIAQSLYQVPRVVARNFEPRYRSLFESFNIQVLSGTSWGAQRMEEMIYYNEVRTVFSAGNGEIEIYEMTIPQNWDGRRLQDLMDCPDLILVALTRGGKAFLPNPETLLRQGDILHASASCDGIEVLRDRIGSKG